MEKGVSVSPEYAALKQQYHDLREELAKLAAEREMLLTTEKRNLEKQYYLKVGRKQYTLFALRNAVLRLRRKAELIRGCLNRGEEYNLEQIEERLDEELRQWEEETRELIQKIQYAEFIDKLPLLIPEESQELRKLFRQLVRRLHPDLNPRLPENLQYLWSRVRAAYDEGDLHELRTLALLVEETGRAAPRLTALEELQAALEHLKEIINHFLQHMARLNKQFPFNLREKLSCSSWAAEQNEAMDKQIEQYQQQKLLYLSQISELTAGGGALLH